MEDINTNVVFTLLLVSLLFNIDPCLGKVFYRKTNKGDSIVLNFKEVDENHDLIKRFRRETSGESSDQSTNVAVKGNLTSTTFYIPDHTHTQAVVQWSGKDSNVLFVLTRERSPDEFIVSSTLWRSSDYGTTFRNVKLGSTAVPHMIYKSPVDKKQLIITDLTNKHLYISEDEGNTWILSPLTFQPDSLLLHPTDQNCLLAYSIFEMTLMVSMDFGRTWNVLRLSVSEEYFWAVAGVDHNIYTVHMEIADFLTNSEYVACIAPNCTVIPQEENIGVILPYSLIVQNEYMFIQKSKANNAPDLYVSYRRGPFRKAYFPMDVHPRDYLILDTSEKQVFVAVDHEENMVNLYVSDITGQFYVLSISNVVTLFEPGWFIVDLYKVAGVSNAYITNQYTDPDSKGNVYERSYISYDKGGTWQLLEAPDHLKSTCKDPKNCNLHLHLEYSNNLYSIPEVVSKKEAPGLILAHGVVGETLYDGMVTNVFISRNNGMTWTQAPFQGYYHLNILDQGSALTAILQNNRNNKTNVVLFSVDEGASWQNYTFSSQKMYVDGVVNEPGINTVITSVFGRLTKGGSRQIVKLDFSTVLTKKCTGPDYEQWMPRPGTCILGQSIEYQRKKPDSVCYNGRNYTRPIVTKICTCTEQDFECDYGFEMRDPTHRICTKANWYNVSLVKLNCRDGEPYNVSQGYRKRASDKCVGGSEVTAKYKPVQTPCPIIVPEGLKLRAPKSVFAANQQITFTLTQEKGSKYTTTYTWSMGDGTKPQTFTGLKNASKVMHKFTTAGTYNVTVYAENGAGKVHCFVTISIENALSAIYVDIPFGSQVGKFTWFNITLLNKRGHTNFGLVHYVWKFGDQPIKEEPLLTWNARTHHVYTKSGRFNVSVEAVNSISSARKIFTVDVYSNLTTVQLTFTKNLDSFNSGHFLWRKATADLLAMDLVKLLHIPTSQLIVTMPPGLPTVADVTILPPRSIRGQSRKQVLENLLDKVQSGSMIFSLLSDDDIIKITGVHILHNPDMEPVTNNTSNTSTSSLPVKDTVVVKTSPDNLTVMIVVPVIIVILVMASIAYYIYRKKSNRDRRYSLIMNRGRYDETILDEDDLDEDFIEAGDEFESEDGNTNIVINTSQSPALVMMTNNSNNHELNTALC